MPLDDVDAEGARMQDLDDRRLTEPWRRVAAAAWRRARALSFEAGRDVCDGVRGRLRYELRLTWLGGTRILDRLDRVDYNVFMSGRRSARRMCRAPVARSDVGHRPRAARAAGGPATKQ